MIYLKEADFGLSSLSINWERFEAVLFSNPHIITSVTFITRRPKPELNMTLIIEPFDTLVWVCFFIVLLFILFYSCLSSRYLTEMKNIDLSWTMISLLLRQQISYVLPLVVSLRLVLCCWLLACIVLTSSYSGCLYSLMTYPPRIKTIDTLINLAIAQRNGEIQVIANENSSYGQWLKVQFFYSVFNIIFI